MQHRTPLMVLAMIGLSQVSYAASDDSAASARLEARASLEQVEEAEQNRSQRTTSKKVVKRASSRREQGEPHQGRAHRTSFPNDGEWASGPTRSPTDAGGHGQGWRAEDVGQSTADTDPDHDDWHTSRPPAREKNTSSHTSRPPARDKTTVTHTSRPPARDKGVHHTSRPQSPSSRPLWSRPRPQRPPHVVRTSLNVRVVHRRPTTRVYHAALPRRPGVRSSDGSSHPLRPHDEWGHHHPFKRRTFPSGRWIVTTASRSACGWATSSRATSKAAHTPTSATA